MNHVKHGQCFDVDHLAVIFKTNLVTCFQLCFSKDLVGYEQVDILLVKHVGKCVGRCLQVVKSTLFSLFYPGLVISVAVEDYALMFFYGLHYKVVKSLFKILRAFESVRKLFQLFRNGSVKNGVCAGYGSRRTEHTELKLVACKRERACSVSVRRVSRELGKRMNAYSHKFFLLCVVF